MSTKENIKVFKEKLPYENDLLRRIYENAKQAGGTGQMQISVTYASIDQNTDLQEVGIIKSFAIDLLEKLKEKGFILNWDLKTGNGHSSDDGGWQFEYNESAYISLVPSTFIELYESCGGNALTLSKGKIVICIDPLKGIYPENDRERRYKISQSGEGAKRFSFITLLYNSSKSLPASQIASQCHYSRSNKISDEHKGINRQFQRHTEMIENLILYSEGNYSLNRDNFDFQSVQNS